MAAGRPQDLARRLGHDFADPALLETALTHPSFVGRGSDSYERLEFLGDRVLGLAVADLLMELYPAENEGDLARRYALLVDRDSLAQVAGELGLGDWLRMTQGEAAAGTRGSASVLADAMEAVIGALYRDGGFEVAAKVVRRLWAPLAGARLEPPKDAKTVLQEWAQARALSLPVYRVVSRTGPDHALHFTVEVSVTGHAPARGEGRARRAAERAAATALFAAIAAQSGENG